MNTKSVSGIAILSAAYAINHVHAAQVNLGNGYMLDTQVWTNRGKVYQSKK